MVKTDDQKTSKGESTPAKKEPWMKFRDEHDWRKCSCFDCEMRRRST